MSFWVIPTDPPYHLSRPKPINNIWVPFGLTSDDLAEQGKPGADLEGAEVALHDPPFRP